MHVIDLIYVQSEVGIMPVTELGFGVKTSLARNSRGNFTR